jgi:hypothetical protein
MNGREGLVETTWRSLVDALCNCQIDDLDKDSGIQSVQQLLRDQTQDPSSTLDYIIQRPLLLIIACDILSSVACLAQLVRAQVSYLPYDEYPLGNPEVASSILAASTVFTFLVTAKNSATL